MHDLAAGQVGLGGRDVHARIARRPGEGELRRRGRREIPHQFGDLGIAFVAALPVLQQANIVLGIVAEAEFAVHRDDAGKGGDRRLAVVQRMQGGGDVELHDGGGRIVQPGAVEVGGGARRVQRLVQFGVAACGVTVGACGVDLVGDVRQPGRAQRQHNACGRPRRHRIQLGLRLVQPGMAVAKGASVESTRKSAYCSRAFSACGACGSGCSRRAMAVSKSLALAGWAPSPRAR